MLSRSGDLRVPRWAGVRFGLPARWATPVLVVAALLCGLGVGSAVFAALWRNETAARQAADQALVQERMHVDAIAADLRGLRSRLHASERTAAAAARTAADRKTLIAGLDRSAGSLLAASRPLQDEAASITGRARSLSSLIRTLDNDLASLSRYVSGADSSTLDPAFLQAQLAYLKPSLSDVGSTADALAGQANRYSAAVRSFVRSASAYAATVNDARER